MTWTSSDENIAAISNAMSTEGLADARNLGTADITATFNGVTGITTLTVTPAELVSIAITPADPSLARGTTQQLTATGTYTDATTQDLTDQVTWMPADPNIAMVSNAMGSRGLATALNTGSTIVTATLGTVSGTTNLTVTPAQLVSITVTPANPTLQLGTMQQFTATGTYTDTTTQDLTTQVLWSSSDTNVATVSNAAGSQGLATSVAVGTVTMTATLGSVSGSINLTVTNVQLVSIAITPANSTVLTRRTQQLTATGTYSDSSTRDLTTQVIWSSSNANIATVSNAAGTEGLATAASVGNVMITATIGSVTGTTPLTVVLNEGFEMGSKTGYAAANVNLSSGSWNLNDCLIGTSAGDPRNGNASGRCRNSGTMTMQFDLTAGATTVTVLHARFGTDGNGTWGLFYSIDGGTNYTQAGADVTTSTTTLQTATFNVNLTGAVRFQIRKLDGGANRINFDDIVIN